MLSQWLVHGPAAGACNGNNSEQTGGMRAAATVRGEKDLWVCADGCLGVEKGENLRTCLSRAGAAEFVQQQPKCIEQDRDNELQSYTTLTNS